MSLRWTLWSILAPSQVILGSVALGALLFLAGRRRAGGVLSSTGGLLLILFGVLPTSHYLVHPLESRFPRPALPANVDGIIVLAGSERVHASAVYGEPQVQYNGGRYVTTLRLAQRFPTARVVYTGGAEDDPERGIVGGAMGVARDILVGAGLAPGRILFEINSHDTCDSAPNTREFVNARPGETWVVVTSAIHMPRTMGCFQAIDWDVIPYPADYLVIVGGFDLGSVQVAGNLALLDLAMHEWLGLVYYRLTGRILDWFPRPESLTERAAVPTLRAP